MELAIHPIDLAVIILYMVAITVAGLVSARKQTHTSSGYFLAGRSLRWPMIGMALFATNISTVHLVGLAADGYRVGLVIGNFEWLATLCLLLLGLIFAPFYFHSGITTLPDYLEKRYSPGSRTVLAVMAIVAAMFIHIGMSLYAGSAIFQHFFGIDVYWSILIISVVTAMYTVLGGLKAVVVTEAIQTVVLLLGALAVTGFGVLALRDHGIDSYSALSQAVRPRQLSMLQPDGEMAWYSMFLGYPVLGIWYWCADQTIVQRVLGAKTKADAQIGPVFAGFIKILPVFVMVFPGVIASVLFQEEIGSAPNLALPVLVDELIPVGLKGLIAAGLLAALMSTVAGALNSTSTLVCIDIVKRLKPEVEDARLVQIGRLTACIVMILAMAWSTQGGKFESIFTGINSMIACLAPPITVVFLWGVFWVRGTKQASLVTLLIGFALGMATFALDFPLFGEKKVVTEMWGIPFMLQAWWLFCICSVLFVTISLLTPAPSCHQIEGLCWKHPLAAIVSERFTGLSDPRFPAGVLVCVMAFLYWAFA